MTEMLDQTDLTERAERLVAAAKRAGADAADAVCLRGVSLSVDVRLGKTEETQRAEGDDFSLRAFVGKRSATVSANVLTDPAELAERAVAMARVAPEDPYAGLADPPRLAREFPDRDLLDSAIPSAAELTELARAAEDAARAVPGVTNSGGGSAGWSLGGLVLATSHGFAGSYLTSRFGISASAIAGEGTGMERDYDAEFEDLSLRSLRSRSDRPEGRRARRTPPQPGQGGDRPRHRRLRPAHRHEPRRASLRRHQRRGNRPQDELPQGQARQPHLLRRDPDHRRPDPPARARLAALRRRRRCRGSAVPDQGRRPADVAPRFRRAPASSASPPTAAPPAAAAIPRPARPT